MNIRKQKDASFYIMAGSSISIWGIGLLLLFMQTNSETPVGVLALILPIAVITLLIATFSRSDMKRRDASHLALLTTAITLDSILVQDKSYFFIALSLIILIFFAFNLRRKLAFAPIGVSAIFVSIYAPEVGGALPIAFFIVTMATTTVFFGRHQESLAVSVFPFSASILTLNNTIAEFQTLHVFVLICGLIFCIYFLQSKQSKQFTPRRLFLDDLLVFFGLVILSKVIIPDVITLENDYKEVLVDNTPLRYLVISLMFFTAWIFSGFLNNQSRFKTLTVNFKKRIFGTQENLRTTHQIRRNSMFAISCLSLYLAIRYGQYGLSITNNQVIKTILEVGLMSWIFYLGTINNSNILKDLAKILLVFTVLFSVYKVSNTSLNSLSLNEFILLITSSYYAIGVAAWMNSRDLRGFSQGPWQGVFSGRSLVYIRRTRSQIYEVASQAPLFGWVVTLIAKAASNLTTSFGHTKSWTISHYCICIVVIAGLFIAIDAAQEILINRADPYNLSLLPSTVMEMEKPEKYLESFGRLLGVLIYCSIIFTIGAIGNVRYLRFFGTTLSAFVFTFLWFATSSSKEPHISVGFYPLSFLCYLIITRIAYPEKKKKSSTDVPLAL